MKKKKIILLIIICAIIIGVTYLFVFQLSGRWIYVHEFESTPDPSEFYNLTTDDIERFPFLLESIQKNADVHISEEEYHELWNFLGDNLYIKWNNRYYDVQLSMSNDLFG